MKKKIIDKKYVKYILLGFGFLLVLSVNAIYNYIQNGDFLAYFNINFHHYTNLYGGVIRDPGYYSKALINFNLILDPKKNLVINFTPNSNFGYFYYFVILAMIYITAKKIKAGYFFMLWIITFWLYLQFGSMSLSHYIIIHRLHRFLAIIVPPSLICLSYLIYTIKNTHLKILCLIIPIFLFITSINLVNGDRKEMLSCINDTREASKIFANLPKKTIYAEGNSWNIIKYYLKYDWNIISLESFSNLNEIRDSYVYTGGQWGCVCTPKWEYNIPDWKLLKTIYGRIDGCRPSDAKIYLAS
jgi:hypothetical protein